MGIEKSDPLAGLRETSERVGETVAAALQAFDEIASHAPLQKVFSNDVRDEFVRQIRASDKLAGGSDMVVTMQQILRQVLTSKHPEHSRLISSASDAFGTLIINKLNE